MSAADDLESLLPRASRQAEADASGQSRCAAQQRVRPWAKASLAVSLLGAAAWSLPGAGFRPRRADERGIVTKAFAGDNQVNLGFVRGTSSFRTFWATGPKRSASPRQAKRASGQALAGPLPWARTVFSERTATAFAALAKLAYCGPLPGFQAAVEATCSSLHLPGVTSVCQRAGFSILQGTTHLVALEDLSVPDAIFAWAARVRSSNPSSGIGSGVLLTFRGSIGNAANKQRDFQYISMERLKGCDECGAHRGYLQVWWKLQEALLPILRAIRCYPRGCQIHLAAHGSGGAVGTLAAWFLERSGYSIGTSYFFESTRIGNKAFAGALEDRFLSSGKDGPIFLVSNHNHMVTQWPPAPLFASWGVEVLYSLANASGGYVDMCLASDSDCRAEWAPDEGADTRDTCRNPLAPHGTFCEFESFSKQCFAGLGFEVAPLPKPEATASPTARQPPWRSAAERRELVQRYYSADAMKAFAALVKLSYCGQRMGLRSAVQSTCTGATGPCSAAGFGVVPQTVALVRGRSEAHEQVLAYVARIRRVDPGVANASHFLPAEACVLIVSNRADDFAVASDAGWQPNATVCRNCTDVPPKLDAWMITRLQTLQQEAVYALSKSGCTPNALGSTTNKVFVAGHSVGGTLGNVLFWALGQMGFDMQLSWFFEAPRPEASTLRKYLVEPAVVPRRPVPFWRVTRAGSDALLLSAPKAGSHGRGSFYEVKVHSDDGSPLGPVMLADTADDLGGPQGDICSMPLAPEGGICMFPEYQGQSEFRNTRGRMSARFPMANQCKTGGPLPA